MGIRKYKLTMPSHRDASVSDSAELTRSTLKRSLLVPGPKTSGRSNSGRITARHIGGGHRQAYRIIDFKCYDKDGVPAKVAHIEYDPNRTARIALLHYHDGEKRYIIAPNGLTQGIVVVFGPGSDIRPGNNLGLRQTPVGTTVHAVELRPGSGAELGRSAGTAIQLATREGKYAALRMPSDEIRMVDARCRAAIGTVGNAEQSNIDWGRAGRNRWKGIRPTVRGIVINPAGHPHGGGEGRTSGSHHPVPPWDKPEGRTRNKSKASSRLVARRRKAGERC